MEYKKQVTGVSVWIIQIKVKRRQMWDAYTVVSGCKPEKLEEKFMRCHFTPHYAKSVVLQTINWEEGVGSPFACVNNQSIPVYPATVKSERHATINCFLCLLHSLHWGVLFQCSLETHVLIAHSIFSLCAVFAKACTHIFLKLLHRCSHKYSYIKVHFEGVSAQLCSPVEIYPCMFISRIKYYFARTIPSMMPKRVW